MASRSIQDLTPRMQERINAFEEALAAADLGHFRRSCTYRSQAEQNCLWLQGRKSLRDVNAAREVLGLPAITLAQNAKVTWRTVSVHTSREAVDYYVLHDGRANWDVKVDVNQNDIPDWEEFGRIAEACGLEWGGSWAKRDLCHVQWRDEV
jgi:hypothetical protein